MKYELPTMPYPYEALEPVISREIMALHHQKHHAAYVNNLNVALEKHPEIADRPLEDLLKNLDGVPEDIRTAVRNHGGGHFNHTFFWDTMKPPSASSGQAGGAKLPSGSLAEAISRTFESFEKFQELFNKSAVGRFGSGWGWLNQAQDGKLTIHSTPNQDTPLAEGLTPLLGLDVWEHAYYLQYKSDRAGYVAAWWQLVNWDVIGSRFRN